MDYVGIIKRSWQITWKYKILWLFGLLAGGSSGNFNNGSSSWNTGGGSGDMSGLEQQASRGADAFSRWFTDDLAIAVALIVIFTIAGIALWIISIAAQGGLVRLASSADEERPVLGRDGWAAGFRYWGRTFLIQLVLALPVVVLVIALVVAAFVSFVPAMAAGEESPGAVLGSIGIMCGVFAIAVPLIIIVGFVLGSMQLLALRYGILEDRPSFQAIGASWGAFKARWKQVLGMWLAMLLVGIMYGIVAGVVAVGFALPAGVALIAGNVVAFAGIMVVLVLMLLLPNAIYAALQSTAWTVFFRRLTGVAEVVAAGAPAPAPAYAGAAAAPGYLPPPPPPVAPAAAEPGYTAAAPEPPAPAPPAPDA